MVLLQRESKDSEEISSSLPHLLEIHSNCEWDSIRSQMLGKLSVLADKGSYPDPSAMVIKGFLIEILSKPNHPTSIPPHLRKNLPSITSLYPIRIYISRPNLREKRSSSPCVIKIEPDDEPVAISTAPAKPDQSNPSAPSISMPGFVFSNNGLTPATLYGTNTHSQPNKRRGSFTSVSNLGQHIRVKGGVITTTVPKDDPIVIDDDDNDDDKLDVVNDVQVINTEDGSVATVSMQNADDTDASTGQILKQNKKTDLCRLLAIKGKESAPELNNVPSLSPAGACPPTAHKSPEDKSSGARTLDEAPVLLPEVLFDGEDNLSSPSISCTGIGDNEVSQDELEEGEVKIEEPTMPELEPMILLDDDDEEEKKQNSDSSPNKKDCDKSHPGKTNVLLSPLKSLAVTIASSTDGKRSPMPNVLSPSAIVSDISSIYPQKLVPVVSSSVPIMCTTYTTADYNRPKSSSMVQAPIHTLHENKALGRVAKMLPSPKTVVINRPITSTSQLLTIQKNSSLQTSHHATPRFISKESMNRGPLMLSNLTNNPRPVIIRGSPPVTIRATGKTGAPNHDSPKPGNVVTLVPMSAVKEIIKKGGKVPFMPLKDNPNLVAVPLSVVSQAGAKTLTTATLTDSMNVKSQKTASTTSTSGVTIGLKMSPPKLAAIKTGEPIILAGDPANLLMTEDPASKTGKNIQLTFSNSSKVKINSEGSPAVRTGRTMLEDALTGPISITPLSNVESPGRSSSVINITGNIGTLTGVSMNTTSAEQVTVGTAEKPRTAVNVEGTKAKMNSLLPTNINFNLLSQELQFDVRGTGGSSNVQLDATHVPMTKAQAPERNTQIVERKDSSAASQKIFMSKNQLNLASLPAPTPVTQLSAPQPQQPVKKRSRKTKLTVRNEEPVDVDDVPPVPKPIACIPGMEDKHKKQFSSSAAAGIHVSLKCVREMSVNLYPVI